jgi:hypothetical protein
MNRVILSIEQDTETLRQLGSRPRVQGGAIEYQPTSSIDSPDDAPARGPDVEPAKPDGKGGNGGAGGKDKAGTPAKGDGKAATPKAKGDGTGDKAKAGKGGT